MDNSSSVLKAATANSMTDWWTYHGISGPKFWGLFVSEWRMCDKGQHQSPINIDPAVLLFDPGLKALKVDKIRTSVVLENTGQLLRLSKIDSHVTISGGPLGAYRYRLNQILFHYGLNFTNGSEHTIDNERFPGELQLIGYNTDLYSNFSEAMNRPRGLVGIAVMIDIGKNRDNAELKLLTSAIKSVTYKGRKAELASFSPYSVLPETNHYVTYEGSLTFPGCYETVTWIVLNKPVYITKRYGGSSSSCPTMYKEMYYKANPLRKQSKPQQGYYPNSQIDRLESSAVYIDKMDL